MSQKSDHVPQKGKRMQVGKQRLPYRVGIGSSRLVSPARPVDSCVPIRDRTQQSRFESRYRYHITMLWKMSTPTPPVQDSLRTTRCTERRENSCSLQQNPTRCKNDQSKGAKAVEGEAKEESFTATRGSTAT
jgi:hypothetical protein